MRQITLVLLITLASSALADEWLLETSDAEILGQGKIIHIEKMNELRRFEILVSHKGITWWETKEQPLASKQSISFAKSDKDRVSLSIL